MSMSNHEQIIMAMTVAEITTPVEQTTTEHLHDGHEYKIDHHHTHEHSHEHDHEHHHTHDHSHESLVAYEGLNIFQKLGRIATSKIYNSKLINSPNTEQVLAGTCCGNICSKADLFAVFTGGALLAVAMAKNKWPSKQSKNQALENEE